MDKNNWCKLYRAGGAAGLLAGVIFRRNIAAEIGLFSGKAAPETVEGWFELLARDRLVGLALLNVFDVVNAVLVALLFLALAAVLWRAKPGTMAVAGGLAFLGVATCLASNPALSMLALSERYAAAGGESQREALRSAGEALLALGRFSGPEAHPGSGGLPSLALVAAAGMLASLVMLRSQVFKPGTAIVGILASGLDLAYCSAYLSRPQADPQTLALIFIPAAGLFWMAWHILVGWRLIRMGKPAQ
jgi:hypothetical protein